MGYYEANLALLSKKEPGLARRIERVKIERDISYLPLRKTRLNLMSDLKMVNTIVVLGFGSGDEIKDILGRVTKKSLVLVIDPDLTGFKRSLLSVDLTPLLSSSQLSLSIGEDPYSATRKRLDEFYKINTISEIELIPNTAAINGNRAYFGDIIKHLKDAANGAAQNKATLAEFASLWQENLLLNLPAMIAYPGVNRLFGRFKDMPAVLVAAGPSLDRDLEDLAKIEGKAVLIACDTALKTLLSKGIEPDITLSLDGGEANYKHFQGTRSKTALVAVSITHPKIISEFTGPIFMADFAHPLNQWFSLFIGEKGYLKTGGSVVTACFDLARLMGVNPIIFTGLDLAFSGGMTHSSGSSYTEEALGTITKFHTLEMAHRQRIQNEQLVSVEGNDGRRVLTSHKYLTYLRWLESEIASNKDRTIINTSLTGARMAGASLMNLTEAIKRFLQREVAFADLVKGPQVFYRPPSLGSLREALTDLVEEFTRTKDISSAGRDVSRRLVCHLEKGDGARGMGLFKELNPLYQGIIRRQGFMKIARLSLEPLLCRMEDGNNRNPLARARACEDFFSSIADYCQTSIEQFGHTRDGFRMLCPK